MTDRHEITLREVAHSGPNDIIEKIKNAVDELFDSSVSGAANFVKGRGEQEIAKAAEIKSKVMSHLGGLELERQKLVSERDIAKNENKQRMYELRTERLKMVIDALIRLRELGVEVEIRTITSALLESVESDRGIAIQ